MSVLEVAGRTMTPQEFQAFRDKGEATRQGVKRLFNLAGLLTLSPVAVVGPQGEPGRVGASGRDSVVPGPAGRDSNIPGPAGQSIVGPSGKNGLPGPAGKDGKDSTIPGPAGKDGRDGKDSTVPGPKGDRGDVLIPNESELAAAVIALRQERAKTQAAILIAIADAKTTSPGVRVHVMKHLNGIKAAAGI